MSQGDVRVNLNFYAILARLMRFRFRVSSFLLSPPLAMVGAEIAVLADSVRVVGPVNVGTLVGWFLPASRVVAVLAHTLCIKLLICMWTGGHDFFVLWLLGLVGLLALHDTSFAPSYNFSTQTTIMSSWL